MDNQLIERIVAEIEKRIKKPVLLVLTPAPGYRDEIYQRISHFSTVRASIFVTTQAQQCHDLSQWCHVGDITQSDKFDTHRLSAYQALFIPYFDKKLVGEIINGLMISEEGTLIHSALAKNIPVIALPYFCQPSSEINEILGLNQNEQYNLVLKQNIEQLVLMGITFCSINEVEDNLKKNIFEHKLKYINKTETKKPNNNRYITLKQVMSNPKKYQLSQDKLTDSAIEYLKSLKD
ncbi:hypothetical protein PT008_17155 [Proteus mirabilis]|uniref:hypothetical protein n=1 Tax=Proteus mirabilis TaxID=584 RepID=UPI00240E07BF|nr:hypothetical protein [Proteus mirabilis]WFC28210.1 hypothetical protein PT008_17155 [Proteus mirabilis]HEJ9541527.1 hypothetical protein [Proteus mirabilis]